MKEYRLQEAYDYFDGLTDDREASVALAVHMYCMEHWRPPAEPALSAAERPFDVFLLYRAAVSAFLESPAGGARGARPAAGRVVNREGALRRLAAITDEWLRRRAHRFVDEVIKQSEDSPSEQDLPFLLDIFLAAIGRCAPEMIETGELNRLSRRLEDPDNW